MTRELEADSWSQLHTSSRGHRPQCVFLHTEIHTVFLSPYLRNKNDNRNDSNNCVLRTVRRCFKRLTL